MLIEMVELRDQTGRPASYWINGKRINEWEWWRTIFSVPKGLSKMAFPETALKKMNSLLKWPLPIHAHDIRGE